jgi:hypothetical protein
MISIINFKFYKNFTKFLSLKKKTNKQIKLIFNNIIAKHYSTNNKKDQFHDFDKLGLLYFFLNYNSFICKHNFVNKNLYAFVNKFIFFKKYDL